MEPQVNSQCTEQHAAHDASSCCSSSMGSAQTAAPPSWARYPTSQLLQAALAGEEDEAGTTAGSAECNDGGCGENGEGCGFDSEDEDLQWPQWQNWRQGPPQFSMEHSSGQTQYAATVAAPFAAAAAPCTAMWLPSSWGSVAWGGAEWGSAEWGGAEWTGTEAVTQVCVVMAPTALPGVLPMVPLGVEPCESGSGGLSQRSESPPPPPPGAADSGPLGCSEPQGGPRKANNASRSRRQRRARALASLTLDGHNFQQKRRDEPVVPPAPEQGEAAPTVAPEVGKKWIADLEAGGSRQQSVLQRLRGSIWKLTMEQTGCRVVQTALRVADRAVASELSRELHGHVKEALESPHGNFVLQKLVEVLPTTLSSFVASELAGAASAAARHCFGCRVLCRLLEHSAASPRTVELVDEMLQDASWLSRHSFGQYVMQAVLEYGLPEQRRRVVASVLGCDLLRLARNRNASYVVEKAIRHAAPEDQRVIAAALLGGGDAVVVQLAVSQFGAYVVKALMSMPEDEGVPQGSYVQALRGALLREAKQIQSTKYGKRLFEDLGFQQA